MSDSVAVDAILVTFKNRGIPGADVLKSFAAILLNFKQVGSFLDYSSTFFISVSRNKKAIAPILMVFSRGNRRGSTNRFD